MFSACTRRFFIASACLAVVALLGQMIVPSIAAAKGGGLVGVEGILVSVNPSAGTLVIRTRRGQNVTIATDATTKIERNDRRATLAAFLPGDGVQAKFTSATSTIAIKVEAVGP